MLFGWEFGVVAAYSKYYYCSQQSCSSSSCTIDFLLFLLLTPAVWIEQLARVVGSPR
jgi:hypothetical protein